MARRDYQLRFECAHPGCNESVTFRYATRRDLINSFELKNYEGGRWKCTRHRNPSHVLSTGNVVTETTLECREETYGRFFGNSGLVYGPGFLAYASDFPPGTKLVVTARIVLPSGAAQ